MKSMYKPNEYEMNLIILYVVSGLKTGATYTILDYIVSRTVDINYFALQNYLMALIESENLTELTVEGEKIYSLTEGGRETIGFFADRIPMSIRDRLDIHIRETNEKENVSTEILADYFPINEKEYSVKLNIKENDITMLNVEMYVGDRERAKLICEYLTANTAPVYSEIINMLNQGADKFKKTEEI